MKQIRLISLCLLLCSVFASLKAQVNTQFDGDYSGTAYNIKMKGELKPSQKMVFRLHNGVLTGAVPKIGKMPGTTLFSIKGISISSDGAMKTSAPNAGSIKMMKLFNSTLYWDNTVKNEAPFYGHVQQVDGTNVLTLRLNIYSKAAGLFRVPASVSFKGKSQRPAAKK